MNSSKSVNRLLLVGLLVCTGTAACDSLSPSTIDYDPSQVQVGLRPSGVARRIIVDGVTTAADWGPYSAVSTGPIGMTIREDGRLLAMGKPGKQCSTFLYSKPGTLVRTDTIDALDTCDSGFATDEGLTFVGDRDGSRYAALTDLEGKEIGSYPYGAGSTVALPPPDPAPYQLRRSAFPKKHREVPVRSAGFMVFTTTPKLVVKMDGLTQVEWTLPLLPDEWIEDGAMTDTGDYILAGAASQRPASIALPEELTGLLLAVDRGGRRLWTKRFGIGTQLLNVRTLDDGNVLARGRVLVDGGTVGWFLAIDPSGKVLWSSNSSWNERPVDMDDVLYVQGTASKLDISVTERDASNLKSHTFSVREGGAAVETYTWPFSISYTNKVDGPCWLYQVSAGPDGSLYAMLHCPRLEQDFHDRWRGKVYVEIEELR